MKELNFRQVHLDFHTFDSIEGIGEKFDKKQFQEALKAGYVNSITLFAKCHHGWAYHPTAVHETHPFLKFDLLGEQLEACREIGVNAPVYISAGLDEKEAVRHPEWLSRQADESTYGGKDFTGTPNYHVLCFNTGYLDLLLAQTEEIMKNYNPSGIFFDISSVHPCYCSRCRLQILAEGKDPRKLEDNMELAERVYKNYAEKTRAVIHKYNPDTTIFHNSGHITKGRRDIAGYNTHLELESLPTGGWGYDHFPLSAAYTRNLGMEFLGMTGKFNTTWGEFGGFKHPNALRYETSLSIACGAKCSIGDQLHPNGKMDISTYNLIGRAYKEIEQKEAWCKNVTSIADIAILSAESFQEGVGGHNRQNHGDIGANRILLEGKYLYDVIDNQQPLENYKLVILPENLRLDSDLKKELEDYLDKGGKILATGTSGLRKEKDEFALDFGIEYLGENTYEQSYFMPEFETTNGRTWYIMYERGHCIGAKGAEILGQAQNPYFNRDTYAFCSHQHTPNNPTHSYPAIALTHNTAYISWDIFTDYAKKGSLHLKEMAIYTIDRLLGEEKTLETNLQDMGIVTLMEQTEYSRLVNHLLFAYTTVRGVSTEVIEDTVPLYDIEVSIRLREKPKRVYLAPQMKDLEYKYQKGILYYTVPKLEIHQMVIIDR